MTKTIDMTTLNIRPLLIGLFSLTITSTVVAELDEGHSEWDYVLCVQDEGGKSLDGIGVMFNAEVLEYACLEKAIYQLAEKRSLNEVQLNWLQALYATLRDDVAQARTGTLAVRERKEYRMLSEEERTRFHKAVNDFKNDLAEKYEALSSLHVGETAKGAHRGPGFLVWNRLYLLLFELALRQYDSDVTLPYWDNTLDSELLHPEQSIIWSDSYMGTDSGRVTRGPFARWRVQKRNLIRNIGQAGRLMKPTNVNKIIDPSFTLKNITFPSANFENNLELHSFGVRLWVGGDMARLDTATNDPLYFVMHAYYDCLWEQFRDQQSGDPQTDWPDKFEGNVAHYPNAQVGVVPNIINQQALRNEFGSSIYKCVRPSCSSTSPSCGDPSSGLRCIQTTFTCQTLASGLPITSPCEVSRGYQNSYCLDGANCDERDWVYVPIEVVYTRHPNYEYSSWPLTSPSGISKNDIYSAASFRRTGPYNTALAQPHRFMAPEFENCPCSGRDSGRLYVQSYGLSYNGTYREYSIVDKRLPVSSVWAYVAVKDPRDSADFKSRAQVRVNDDCGRLCQAGCLVKGSNEYRPCSGVLLATTDTPKQYSETVEDTFYVNWDYTKQYPEQTRNVTFLKFFCDSSAIWPWLTYSFIKDPYKTKPDPPTDPDFEDLQTPAPITTTPAPTTTAVATTTTTVATTTVLIEPEWCFNATECFKFYEPTNCTRCESGTLSLCWDHCGKYIHCAHGVWYIKDCGTGLLWDDRDEIKTCSYRTRVECRKEATVCTGCSDFPWPG